MDKKSGEVNSKLPTFWRNICALKRAGFDIERHMAPDPHYTLDGIVLDNRVLHQTHPSAIVAYAQKLRG